jgi:hypothetical protein
VEQPKTTKYLFAPPSRNFVSEFYVIGLSLLVVIGNKRFETLLIKEKIMSNLGSKLILTSLVAIAGLFGSLSMASEAVAGTDSSSYSYQEAFWYKGDRYYCKDFEREPSNYKHGYYHYCVEQGHRYYLSKYDDNYHQYYKKHGGKKNHDDGDRGGERN